MIPFINERLLADWSSFNVGAKPDRLLFIKYADRLIRSPEKAVLTFLVKGVYKSEQKPLFIVRFPRYSGGEAVLTLQLEEANLRKAAALPNIPRLLLAAEINKAKVVVISFLPGETMGRNIFSEDLLGVFSDSFERSFGWLSSSQKALGAAESLSPIDLVNKIIAEYTAIFPNKAAANKHVFERLQEAASKQSEIRLPLYFQHGDFHVDNIFVAAGRISGIIDWEDAQFPGLPGFDLFHFVKTYFEAIGGAFADQNMYEELAFISSHEKVIGLINQHVNGYYSKMQIDPRLEEVLLPLYLIKSAVYAGSPRKQAYLALKKLDILISLMPHNISDLMNYLSVFGFSDMARKAAKEGNALLLKNCQQKVSEITESAKKQEK
ncbi:hypothetical protein A3K48_00985 [candidate division WOR-1 bacterium RIFOXYA12_FULL_52_29]|uniref:Aminoglycoside phosphotransferase domain-containing protein n=1 Tax=candidate division WOR-1 bacterium RIFOXYC12_FULL_54_18 TaxID=1802584 RepID=A0A1F4T4E7_UNCSA|nr:MAG: hypothetical protein A3K44_00985 [candidate division WOR-1 bacterium RIFOXYA2_FULL_51_19]OGC17167.1 MAG: hypothetical protein A3K48_00985 [candidate division WOR-1 bacterium RIFOXYA12_FULL_52_29]OGC26027.1 MAG: hypothetical protein A3K32_00980 [candidate division WOR-1 bacterium RIFOXYB2_FULL_45_9]OGC27584.1 MAG: hypothetical protein A3K49_00985 [candidate division WOR-1 bacterium RIFOXYC12_FULL_54_18]OGC29203.1 MAG: hypothetical protein A2346_00725 [candidate division WOR-1 bacterium R